MLGDGREQGQGRGHDRNDILFLLVQSRLGDDTFLMPLVTQTLPVAVYSGLVGMAVIRFAALLGVFAREE